MPSVPVCSLLGALVEPPAPFADACGPEPLPALPAAGGGSVLGLPEPGATPPNSGMSPSPVSVPGGALQAAAEHHALRTTALERRENFEVRRANMPQQRTPESLRDAATMSEPGRCTVLAPRHARSHFDAPSGERGVPDSVAQQSL